MEKHLKRIVKPVMDAQPDAPSAIIADIVLIEHRGLLHGWLVGQIDADRKRRAGDSPRRNGRRRQPDPRQEWLDLPEFQHIPAEAQNDTLEEFRQRMNVIEQRIKFYSQPRRSADADKSDKRQLREMQRLEVIIAPFFADDPNMTIGQAVQLYRKQRESAAGKRQRKAIKTRWDRTKNQ